MLESICYNQSNFYYIQEIHHEMKNSVFGTSLLSMTQRTGHPVPITIISAMKYLRRTSIDSVGIFRKP